MTRWLGYHSDAFVGLALVGLAAVFWVEAGEITVYPGDPGLGARGLPTALCGFIALLGVLLVIIDLRQSSAITTDEDVGQKTGLAIKRFFVWVLPLAVLSFLYVEAVQAFQYLLPTIVATAMVLWLFDNRGVIWLIVAPVVAGCLFYGIFFFGLGLYQPPGYWLNMF